MQGDRSVDELLDAIGDERTRTVLAGIARKPGSVKQLTERLDLSQATIYRRIEILREHDLVEERTLVADDGNHYSVYWTDFAGTMVTLDGDEYDVHVLGEEDAPDQLQRLADGFTTD